ETRLLEPVEILLAAFGSPEPAAGERVDAPLTDREIEILACMAEGLSNQEIGRRLYIAAGTVKAHSAAIYRKLDVANRSAAVSAAKDRGLI
ncbi:MAG TPA: response regulator transcription factor, partial [Anaerolineaceae bacterium]|nr:response regulator transcription factor [Anaerolineaceae bacterium]